MTARSRTCRVLMHAHSQWSYDASWPLARIARVMTLLGADVVLMSEHDTGFPADRFEAYREACAAASTARCRLVPGIEYSDPDNAVHILTWGLDRFLGAGRPVLHTLSDVAAAGGAAVFAHPARRDAWRLFDPAWRPWLSAIEIWNRKTDGLAPCPEALRLMRTHGLPGVVGVDFHRSRQIWPLTNRATLAPGALEAGDLEQAVVAALRSGMSRPETFARPVLDPSGEIRSPWFARAEAARQNARRLVVRR